MKIENPFAGMKDIAEKGEDPEVVLSDTVLNLLKIYLII